MYRNYADALRKEFGIERKENKRLYYIGMSLLKEYKNDERKDIGEMVKEALAERSKEDFVKEASRIEAYMIQRGKEKSESDNHKRVFKPHYVYMMKIYVNNKFSGIVKIGYSRNVENREQRFNEAILEFGYSAQRYMHIECNGRFEAQTLEKSLHLALNKFRYTPSHKFDGSTELFNYDKGMDILFDFKYL